METAATQRGLPLINPEAAQRTGVQRVNDALSLIDASLTLIEASADARQMMADTETRTRLAYRFLGVHDLGVEA